MARARWVDLVDWPQGPDMPIPSGVGEDVDDDDLDDAAWRACAPKLLGPAAPRPGGPAAAS